MTLKLSSVRQKTSSSSHRLTDGCDEADKMLTCLAETIYFKERILKKCTSQIQISNYTQFRCLFFLNKVSVWRKWTSPDFWHLFQRDMCRLVKKEENKKILCKLFLLKLCLLMLKETKQRMNI